MASKVFGTRGITDCKIMPLISDTEAGVEYGNLIDIVGMKRLALTPDMVTDELTGDDKMLDFYSELRAINVEIEAAKFPMDAQAAIFGTTVAEGGSGSDTYASLEIGGTMRTIYVKLIGKVDYHTDEPQGDIWVVLYKCKLNPFGLTFSEGYGGFSAEGVAIKRQYDDKLGQIISHALAKNIEASAFPDADSIEAYTDQSITASVSSKVLLAVRVLSASGKGVPYVKVNWSITSTGDLAGSLNSAFAYTDFDGIAIAEYTTGVGVGDNTVHASVSGLTGSPVAFTITVA